MGRWTHRHYDEVLATKVESLINDAIRRCRQDETDEKTKFTLSYESFVESLDEGDAFTSMLIEILVKEVADRQTRSAEDKRLISYRTSASLHSLAVSNIMNHTHHPPSRIRRVPAWDHLSDSPDEDDYEDYNSVLGVVGTSIPEGTRIDASTLYDAYSRPASTGPAVNAYGPYAPSVGHTHDRDVPVPLQRYYQRHLPIPHNQYVTTRTAFPEAFTVVPSSRPTTVGPAVGGASLVRTNSLRRSSRSRIVSLPRPNINTPSDFADFASRRRAMHRSSANHDVPDLVPSSLPGPMSDTQPVIPPPSPYGTSSSSSHLPRASLFDPPSPAAQGSNSRPHSISPQLPQSNPFYRAHVGNTSFMINGSADGETTPTLSLPNWRVESTSADPVALGGSWPTIPPPPLRRATVRPPPPPPPSDPMMHGSTTGSSRHGESSSLTSLLRPEETTSPTSSTWPESWGWSSGERIAAAAETTAEVEAENQNGTETLPGRAPLPEPVASLPTPRSISPADVAGPSSSTSPA